MMVVMCPWVIYQQTRNGQLDTGAKAQRKGEGWTCKLGIHFCIAETMAKNEIEQREEGYSADCLALLQLPSYILPATQRQLLPQDTEDVFNSVLARIRQKHVCVCVQVYMLVLVRFVLQNQN